MPPPLFPANVIKMLANLELFFSIYVYGCIRFSLGHAGSLTLAHQSLGVRAQLLRGVWGPSSLKTELVSPALQGRLPSTVPLGDFFELLCKGDYDLEVQKSAVHLH